MEKRRVANEPAFLLHRRPYTESSVLIDLFSRHHGRIVLIAKGARKLKSRWRGSLLPFQSLIAAWSGRGEVKTVTGIEGEGTPCGLRGKALYCGYYMNELVLRLLHRFDPHEDVFDNYRSALALLSTEGDQERVLQFLKNSYCEIWVTVCIWSRMLIAETQLILGSVIGIGPMPVRCHIQTPITTGFRCMGPPCWRLRKR